MLRGSFLLFPLGGVFFSYLSSTIVINVCDLARVSLRPEKAEEGEEEEEAVHGSDEHLAEEHDAELEEEVEGGEEEEAARGGSRDETRQD